MKVIPCGHEILKDQDHPKKSFSPYSLVDVRIGERIFQ